MDFCVREQSRVGAERRIGDRRTPEHWPVWRERENWTQSACPLHSIWTPLWDSPPPVGCTCKMRARELNAACMSPTFNMDAAMRLATPSGLYLYEESERTERSLHVPYIQYGRRYETRHSQWAVPVWRERENWRQSACPLHSIWTPLWDSPPPVGCTCKMRARELNAVCMSPTFNMDTAMRLATPSGLYL